MDENTLYNLVLLVLLIVFIAYFYFEVRSRREKREESVTRVLLQCVNCGFKLERDFEAGDYIGLERGKCPKCGGTLKIRGIYAVEKSRVLSSHKPEGSFKQAFIKYPSVKSSEETL